MGYGDVLVHTTGPSYGQNIVRNVGTAGGGGGTPDAHAPSHQDGASDELPLSALDLTLVDDLAILIGTDGAYKLLRSTANGLMLSDTVEQNYLQMDNAGSVSLAAQTELHLEVNGGGTAFLIAFTGDAVYVDFLPWNFYIPVAFADVEIDGALNHDGSTAGFYGAAPVAQGAHLSGAGITAAAIYAQLELMGIFAAA